MFSDMSVANLIGWLQEHTYLLYGVLFIGIIMLIESVYTMTSESRLREEAQINRRLAMLAKGGDRKEVLEALRRRPLHEEDGFRAVAERLAILERLDRLLGQAGTILPVSRVLIMMIVLTVVVCAAFIQFAPLNPLLALPTAIVVGVGLPLAFIVSRKKKRLARFAQQLPEALDLIVRSLRVGHPLSQSFGLVATELPDPIGTEFGIAVDEMTYGLDLEEAVVNISNRVESPDMNFVVVAVSIQHKTGGNLSEVLDGLSDVIRSRFNLKKKILAVSAEGRMSAVFLTFFPLGVVAMIWIMNPNYYLRVMDNPMFMLLATIGGALCLLNSLIARWLVNFKV